jgi:hypothetical protein
MSEEEKASQVGTAVWAYDAAKTALAHIEEKIKKVQNAYKQAAESGNSPYPALRVVDGKLAGHSGTEAWMSYLMNESEFAALLSERGSCEADLKAKRAVMNSLGLGNIQ